MKAECVLVEENYDYEKTDFFEQLEVDDN